MSNNKKEKGCKFCRIDGVKLSEEIAYWELPTDVHSISSDLIFTNTENKPVLTLEVNYVDDCYIDHCYVNEKNINYCPICGRKLRK